MTKTVTYAGVAILAFFVGIFASFFTLPLWIAFAINAGRAGNPSDWLGFSGSIIGAAMTILAALIAWLAVDRQIRTTKEIADRERNEMRLLIRQDVENYCHAVRLVWRAANRALEEEESQAVRDWRCMNVLIFLDRLTELHQLEQIAEEAKSLGPLSARTMATVVWAHKELARISEAYGKEPPLGQDRMRFQTRLLRTMQSWFLLISQELGAFEPQFAKMFVGLSQINGSDRAPLATQYEEEWQSALDDEDWIRRRERTEHGDPAS